MSSPTGIGSGKYLKKLTGDSGVGDALLGFEELEREESHKAFCRSLEDQPHHRRQSGGS